MYIITRIEIITNEVKIIEVFSSEIEAINHLHKCVSELSEDETLDIQIINQSRIEIFKRVVGWIWGRYKDLEYVYQLSVHEEKECCCSSEFFSSENQ